MRAVIIYTKGPAWIDDKPFWEQGLHPHRLYLVDVLQDRLVSAGPFTDHTGGLVIINVETLEEAEEVTENDPAVLEEKFTYEVHPWKPLEGLFVENG
ncbi:YciI family protein [Priestia taiwanensis]|uniref:YCII-related domain-containing protein n=1 Tax=Priestia taiwanensis TaxID=1347902 RepID=A0A917EPG6_9BACI|nr:YciI family protein [Priestia taiwanensis]MBM7362466.1 uncharacterized protein YciI [Priestia taiwanensis]GGE62412.1 hypothetical protein GCM10007140_10890 [Priestia taiwanensis]